MVDAAMMYAMTAKYRGRVMWKYRSPVLSACQALRKVVMTAKAYGGTVKSREVTLENPRVLTTVGNRFVTVPDATKQKRRTIYKA